MASRAPSDQERREQNAPLVEWLAREEWNTLARAARRSGAPPDAIADVVQSALLSVLRSFPGPHERDGVRRYACRCAQREAWDVARRRSRDFARTATTPVDGMVDMAAAPSEAEPTAHAVRAEALGEAREALRQLPTEERAALVLLAAGFDRAEVRRALHRIDSATATKVDGDSRYRSLDCVREHPAPPRDSVILQIALDV